MDLGTVLFVVTVFVVGGVVALAVFCDSQMATRVQPMQYYLREAQARRRRLY